MSDIVLARETKPIPFSLTIEYAHLCEEVGWERRNYVEFHEALEGSLLVVTARSQAGALVGAARLTGDVFAATLFDVVVHPDHQRCGVGKSMLTYIMGFCRAAGIKRIYCLADNPESSAYWAHQGWLKIDGYQYAFTI